MERIGSRRKPSLKATSERKDDVPIGRSEASVIQVDTNRMRSKQMFDRAVAPSADRLIDACQQSTVNS